MLSKMVYVPRKRSHKQKGINNNDGEYEGIWSGPIELDPFAIRKSHNTSKNDYPARGYENVPIRVLRHPDGGYRIVDGNKRLAKAKARKQSMIQVYIFEGLMEREVKMVDDLCVCGHYHYEHTSIKCHGLAGDSVCTCLGFRTKRKSR